VHSVRQGTLVSFNVYAKACIGKMFGASLTRNFVRHVNDIAVSRQKFFIALKLQCFGANRNYIVGFRQRFKTLASFDDNRH
jgi:hypothetical protein